MKCSRKFLKCAHCGNIVGVIDDRGPAILCCGEPMKAMVPNTTDAAQEKHVPVATRSGDSLIVQVGSALHPMSEEHHIAWLMVAQEGFTQRADLEHTGEPKATFAVRAGDATVYAYCNLHGLWAADVQ